jgi:hypothetical protein
MTPPVSMFCGASRGFPGPVFARFQQPHGRRSVLGVEGRTQRAVCSPASIGWFHTVALAVKVDVARRRHRR